MSSSRRIASSRRTALVAVSTLLLLHLAVAPSQAVSSSYSGGPTLRPTHCPLTRVNDQLVRCDDLTGNGVRAPLWMQHQS